MNLTALVGDAFGGDSRELKIYGKSVYETPAAVNSSDLDEIPQLKFVAVSQSKFEPIPASCRNLLAVTQSCISYVTTAKRNIIRVIDTSSAASKILKGHDSYITDIKFSWSNRHILCSIDNSSKVHVWSADRSENQIVRCFPITGTIIQNNPSSPYLWAVVDKSVIVLLSVDLSNGDTGAGRPHELSRPIVLPGDIIDFTYSGDGSRLLVGISTELSTSVEVFQLPSTESMLENMSTANVTPLVSQSISESFWISQGLTLESVFSYDDLLLTCSSHVNSSVAASSPSCVLHVWDLTKSNKQPIQELHLSFPGKAAADTGRSGVWNYRIAPNDVTGRFIIISNVGSSTVACLATHPALSVRNSSILPIYHISYLNLKRPPLSLGLTTILGPDEHSGKPEDVRYLEISCWQENDAKSQLEVNQYLIQCQSIAPSRPTWSNEEVIPIKIDNIELLTGAGGQSTTMTRAVTNHTSGSSVLSTLLDINGTNAVDFKGLFNSTSPVLSSDSATATQSSDFNTITTTAAAATSATTGAPAKLLLGLLGVKTAPVDVLVAPVAVEEKPIMPISVAVEKSSFLKNLLGGANTSVSGSPPAVTTEQQQQQEEIMEAKPSELSTPMPATVSTYNNILERFLQASKPAELRRVNSGVKESPETDSPNKVATAAAAAAAAAEEEDIAEERSAVSVPEVPLEESIEAIASHTTGLPDFLLASSGSTTNKSVLDMLRSNQPSVAPLPAPVQAPIVPAIVPVPVPVPVPKAVPAPMAVAKEVVTAAAAAVGEKPSSTELFEKKAVAVVKKDPKPLVEALRSAPVTAAAASKTTTATATATVAPVVETSEVVAIDPQAAATLKEMRKKKKPEKKVDEPSLPTSTVTVGEVATVTTTPATAATATAATVATADTTAAGAAKAPGTIMQELKKHIDAIVVHELNDKMTSKTLLSQMAAGLVPELKKVLLPMVTEVITKTAASSTEAAMVTSFKGAFEKAIIPAFEDGVNEIFSQVNGAVEKSVGLMVSSMRETNANMLKQQQQVASNEWELKGEISALKSTVSGLHGNIQVLQTQVEAMTRQLAEMNKHMQQISLQAATNKIDPQALLAEGRVSEAVECVLGYQDIQPLVEILSFVSPVQLLGQCPRITQLCVVHRLSEDMAQKDPVEGWSKRMEWMKGLVMSLISTSSSSVAVNVNDIFAREARLANLMCGSASPSSSTPIAGGGFGSPLPNQSNANDAFAESQIKPTFQQIHQNLSKTLMRLIEDVKRPLAANMATSSVPAGLFASPEQITSSQSSASVTERILTLSASNLVAELQLLLTVIGAKYL